MNNKILGNKGEQAAVQYLENHGYLIRERNYRARTGEIDIIASKGDTISFVEVKTRGSVKYGAPAEAVNYLKQQKIIRTAQMYIRYKGLNDYIYRFDVLEILAPKSGSMSFRLIENAFEAV